MFSECEGGKHNKHVLNGATMVPLVVTTFGNLGPSAQGLLQSLADVACSTGVVDRDSWLRIAQQYLSFALVRGRGIVFRYHYQSMAKSAGKDFRDGELHRQGHQVSTIRVRSRNHQPQLQHSGKRSGTLSQHRTDDTQRKENHGSTSLEQLATGSLQNKERTTSTYRHTHVERKDPAT